MAFVYGVSYYDYSRNVETVYYLDPGYDGDVLGITMIINRFNKLGKGVGTFNVLKTDRVLKY